MLLLFPEDQVEDEELADNLAKFRQAYVVNMLAENFAWCVLIIIGGIKK